VTGFRFPRPLCRGRPALVGGRLEKLDAPRVTREMVVTEGDPCVAGTTPGVPCGLCGAVLPTLHLDLLDGRDMVERHRAWHDGLLEAKG
jgi:hypothetical protein